MAFRFLGRLAADAAVPCAVTSAAAVVVIVVATAVGGLTKY